ncbi:MAG: 16S rRNA (guanine(527)-N(7))-methyltransferase RsmG [Clostridia bacterium]|nr:16S rRNA (guanine(527)-N(7))-methyltransferase RsmG [Clostridia bacterium]
MISEILKQWCDENKIEISDSQLSQFEKYAELLKEWNEKMNLTAITDDDGIAVKHFIDSIAVLKFHDLKNNKKVIDIGTGAGFPGIPLKIMRPGIRLTLLDSLNKRLVFLEEVCKNLTLHTELIHARAEEYSLKPEYREQYDTAISRAVANLPALCEYCVPYVKVGGTFVSMKGPDGEKELKAAENAIKLLGAQKENICQTILPDASERTIITIKKIKNTPSKYPRRGQKINKSPL